MGILRLLVGRRLSQRRTFISPWCSEIYSELAFSPVNQGRQQAQLVGASEGRQLPRV